MAIEWTPDYCLTCDHQCPAGAAYCSQSCRLADLERASCTSSNSSPKSVASYTTTTFPTNGFYLPPSYNFPTYIAPTSASSTSAVNSSPSPTKGPFDSYHASTFSYSSARGRSTSRYGLGLQSSPSRSSLASIPFQNAQPESPCMSDKAAQELRDYASCFDQVRDLRRRLSTV